MAAIGTPNKGRDGQNFRLISGGFVRHKTNERKFMKSFSSYSILYAEDNEDTHQMVSLMCQFADIKVTPAETVAEAWQIAQSEHFDLYLLDIRFADGDGLELCRRLRQYRPHTPILIYSGCAFEEDKKRGLEAGADDYLTKPYLGNIAETIQRHIEQNKTSARQTEPINR